ncbi:MAG: response regulator [Bacteroidota bacterium]
MVSPLTEAVDLILVENDLNDAEFVIRTLSKILPKDKILHLRDGAAFLDFLFAVGKYAHRNIRVQPKIVLLDLKLPKVNGIEVLQTMKDNPQTRSIPVVIFSASREEEDLQMCYSLGASSYVVKPIEFKSYVETLTKLAHYWLNVNESPR